jgi:tripartite-type tricarboxylate transporter receptor subunit TctC
MIIRRRGALGAALLLPFGAARAALPDRPLRLLLGFPPGSGPDVLARLLADGLKEALPAGVVVENRPGAGGLIAAQEVAKAAPTDGTTMLLGDVAQLAMAPSTYARLPYDPATDFAAVAEVASADFAFVVPESVPASDLAGYIAWGKTQPQLYMGTFGAGTPGHFGAAMLGNAAGVKVEPVHFRATGDAMTAILSGAVQGMFGSIAVVLPQVRAGKLKALAVTGPQRAAMLPQVPTMAELGHAPLTISAWFGLVAPAAAPVAVLRAVEAEVLRAVATPALASRLVETGFRVSSQGGAGFATLMQRETARWAQVVRATGFRAIE